MWSGRHAQAGFAYLLLLLAVALISLSATAAVSLGTSISRRDAEAELLFIGAEFEAAIRSYAGTPVAATVGTVSAGRGPRSLDELLKDPRVPGVRRHLRQLHADPLTGKHEWGTITDANGFIVGVHSLSDGKPIKQDGFEPRWEHFRGATEYRQWVFRVRDT